MDLITNWKEVKSLFKKSFRSSFHFSVATVTEDGEPHVTPIGSLILGEPGHGFYFEEFPQHLPRNLGSNKKICVMAVNSNKWYWLKSLVMGRFVRRSQPVNATHALNFCAGVLNSKVLRGRSFNCRATALSLA
jgi:uncharacterized protein